MELHENCNTFFIHRTCTFLTSHRYWPLCGAEKYGQLLVMFVDTKQHPGCIERNFKVVDTKGRNDSFLLVEQFQYIYTQHGLR